MRTIKFRCWDNKNKRIIFGECIGFTFLTHTEFKHGDINADGSTNLEEYNESDLSDLMQFTGLLDDKGKEVFEGDIVTTGEGFTGVVEYHVDQETCCAEFVVDTGTEYEDEDDVRYDGEGFKESLQSPLNVIGNVYENPNLLKGTTL